MVMGYNLPEWKEELIERRLKEGRGKGLGAAYKPLLEVHDLSSMGVSRRQPGIKTGRTHHLLSNVEFDFYLMLEWALDVVDIREQYPLDRDLTRELAMALRICHPTYPGTNAPIVMSVDFLVNRIRNGESTLVAFDIKRTEDAEDSRTIDKLELARATCEALDIPHHLVYHSELPQTKIRNIEWILGGQHVEGEVEPFKGYFDEHCARMLMDLANAEQRLPLNEYCSKYDARCGLQQGSGLRVARMLMQRRELVPYLSRPDLAQAVLSSFTVTAKRGQLRAMGGV